MPSSVGQDWFYSEVHGKDPAIRSIDFHANPSVTNVDRVHHSRSAFKAKIAPWFSHSLWLRLKSPGHHRHDARKLIFDVMTSLDRKDSLLQKVGNFMKGSWMAWNLMRQWEHFEMVHFLHAKNPLMDFRWSEDAQKLLASFYRPPRRWAARALPSIASPPQMREWHLIISLSVLPSFRRLFELSLSLYVLLQVGTRTASLPAQSEAALADCKGRKSLMVMHFLRGLQCTLSLSYNVLSSVTSFMSGCVI